MSAKILLSLFAFLFSIVLGEVFFRLVNYPPILDKSFQQKTSNWLHPEKLLNSQGYRDKTYPLRKADNSLRIYALGDSFTFGLYLDDASGTYPEIIERDLMKTSGRNVEVINASFPGFSIADMVKRFEREGKTFKPDIVTVGINYDEVNSGQKGYFDKNTTIPLWLKTSRWYQITAGNYFRNQAEKKYREYILGIYSDASSREWHDFAQKILFLNTQVKSIDASLVLVIFPQIYPADPNKPYDFYSYNRRFKEFGSTNNILVIDSLEKVLEYPDRSQLVVNPSDSHPTYKMHALMASAIIDYFNKNPILLTFHK